MKRTPLAVERVEKSIAYSEFYEKFMKPNVPCLFSAELTAGWRSRREWVDSASRQPNLNFLTENFGDAVVPVVDCTNEHSCSEMKLSDYIEYMRMASDGDDSRKLYLKDWHFVRTFKMYDAYELPVYFKDDWLNEYFDTLGHDDYRFVYMGPSGTWSPFHADVLRSYSWSANVCGLKKWILFPPGEERHFADSLGNFPSDVSQATSAFDQAVSVVVMQQAGEILFVPSGWYHQVYNVEDTISINHNWLNGCCIDLCWSYVNKSLADVKRQIEDCAGMDEWDSTCQAILRVQTGLDVAGFYRLLLAVARRRLRALAVDICCNGTETLTSHAASAAERTISPGPPAPGGAATAPSESSCGERASLLQDIGHVRRAILTMMASEHAEVLRALNEADPLPETVAAAMESVPESSLDQCPCQGVALVSRLLP